MEAFIKSLPVEAQKNFMARAEQFCLTDFQPQVRDLIVNPCAPVTLSASPKERSFISPTMLETRDLDVLKRWIGLSDKAVKGKNLVSCHSQKEMKRYQKDLKVSDAQLSRYKESVESVSYKKANSNDAGDRAATSSLMADLSARVKEDLEVSGKKRVNDSIRDYTKAYLYGDSSLIKEVKPLLEAHYGVFKLPLWPFFNIVVKSGSTLTLGAGANILFAYTLEIESGGKIKSYGNLNISVTNLKKTTKKFKNITQTMTVLGE